MVSFRVREELITYEAAENKKAFTKAGGGGGSVACTYRTYHLQIDHLDHLLIEARFAVMRRCA